MGEHVLCRSHLHGSWRARIADIALASYKPTLSYKQGWCYAVALPQRRGGLELGVIWLPEECLAGPDEESF